MKISNSPPIVKIAFLSLITIILWISFEVYRALTIEPSPEVSEDILKDLDPSLDVSTLNQLQNRIYISDDQISDINIVPKDSVNIDEDIIIAAIEELPTSQNEFVATESGQ